MSGAMKDLSMLRRSSRMSTELQCVIGELDRKHLPELDYSADFAVTTATIYR
jgi:hypothetical protein